MAITKTAVIGAGTMGRGIAAHMANAGAEVILLDIVPENAGDRNAIATQAVEKMKASKRSPFTHPAHAQRITPGNIEDHLDMVADADWIVEAIVEKCDIKQDLYAKLDKVRKDGSLVSSNTSTIPLRDLKDSQSEALKRDLCITHFFNPPRQMRLLELVTDEHNDAQAIEGITGFIERKLGKTVVPAKDTPGFIANRIGIFLLLTGLEEAIERNLPIELADSLFSKPLGFPRTGVFGLMDLIGLDLMVDIIDSMQQQLPEEDRYHQRGNAVSLLRHMVEAGKKGKKSGAGFYTKENGEKKVWDFADDTYRSLKTPEDTVIEAAKSEGLHAALETDSTGGNYVWAVLSETLHYAASLVPEITDDIVSVDTAMKLGFAWERGPFEMMDALGNVRIGGADWFKEALKQEGHSIPPLLEKAASSHAFYQVDGTNYTYLTLTQAYQPMPFRDDQWNLWEKVCDRQPVLKNEAAQLWDIGDGIACLELTTKFDTMDHRTFDLFDQAIDKVGAEFQGMIIGDDEPHYSAGLNLNKILGWCGQEDWQAIEDILKRGQQTWKKLKYAPFPVVGAPSGLALGGACEMLLHCDHVQAYIESNIGLVETRIGVIPAWGGCKEMLIHHLEGTHDPNSQMEQVEKVFHYIANAHTSDSAEDAREMHILRECCGMSMNRDRLLPDAKALCLRAADGYTPPDPEAMPLMPSAAIEPVLAREIERRKSEDNLSNHDVQVLESLAFVLSHGTTKPDVLPGLDLEMIGEYHAGDAAEGRLSEDSVLDLERRGFMALIRTEETQAKIRKALS